ncbi:MAG: glycosyltransferase [Planctomycetota bacterium]|nr:glycosyltransferase [Planctomycetota bacterium]
MATYWLSLTVSSLYSLVLFGLAILGSHRLIMTILAWRGERKTSPLQAGLPENAPTMLLQLPLYNEVSVIERLLDAVETLRYPREKLIIQVLDDSTDETVEVVKKKVEELRARGLPIEQIRREQRVGFKAGALAYGLTLCKSELVTIFDADFVPEADFFEKAIPYFHDARVGLVQARWGHINRRQSLMTRLQAIFLDGHFRVEQWARSATGRFFNFNGTAGIWRRRAIEEAGGWDGDTLTEDLDLSLRAQLLGWRFVYVDEICAPAELPPSMMGFRGQQYRWVKGSAENARKLLGIIWRAPDVALKAKIEATYQLSLNAAYPLVCLLSLLSVPLVGFGLPIADFDILLDIGHLLMVFLASGSVCLFYVFSQRKNGPWAMLQAFLLLPFLLSFGIGLALMNAQAYFSGLMGRKSPFVRTPKEGDKRKVYRADKGHLLPVLEILMGSYLLYGTWLALVNARYFAVPFVTLLGVGFLGFGLLTLWQDMANRAKSPA